MIEREVDVVTAEGTMKTFVFHPTHEGPHPVVLYLMDAPGIRPALRDMAARLGRRRPRRPGREGGRHLGLGTVTAELYFGWCDKDDTAPAATAEVMRAALDAAGVRYTIDWFTDAVHGYAPPGTERYNHAASELHWERVHALLRRNLG